jgi:hypothetical protein
MNQIPSTMIMEMEQRDTFMLVRGNFQSKGDKVTPGVPKSLPPLPKECRRTGSRSPNGSSRRTIR